MIMKILATATCLSICAATSVLAATVNIDGNDYEVSSIYGTFEDNETLLRSQVWWGNIGLAEEVATTVGAIVGDTPVFLFSADENFFGFGQPDTVDGILFIRYLGLDPYFGIAKTKTTSYAIATQVSAAPLPTAPVPAVPLPAGGLLLLSGLGGIATLKRRKKRAAKL